jgi:two-component system, OmpR family, response regulator
VSKVLIVEDQPSMAAMVRHHVEGAGFEVITASEVESAWELLVAEAPDAAIVDIELPGKDGWDLISRSRVDHRTRDLPLVVLTGLHGRDVRERAEAFGAEFFTKPFAASALVNKLTSLVASPIGGEPRIDVVAQVPDTIEGIVDHDEHAGTREAYASLASILEGAARNEAPPPPAVRQVEREAVLPDLSPSGSDHPLDLVAVKVVLLMSQYQIEGYVHMPAELGRFSDAWEQMFAAMRSYVPVTDARVIVQGGQQAVATTPFLQVRKSDIKGIFPIGL